jgi:hypothetical protein
LTQLVEQWIVAHQPPQASSVSACTTTTPTATTTCDILWIATTTRPNPTRDSVLISFEQQYPNTNVTILHAAPDPWGWDSGNDNESAATEPKVCLSSPENLQDTKFDTSIRLDNLPQLAQTIQDHVHSLRLRQQQQQATTANATTTTITPGRHAMLMVWESLSPLLACHGAGPTLQLIETCGGRSKSTDQQVHGCCIITLVPVVQELLTPVQHAQWEDATLRRGACFCLHEGEMTVIRNGVRETGNIVRETLGFEVVPVARISTSSFTSSSFVTGTSGDGAKSHASLSTGAAGRYRLVLKKPEDATSASLDDEGDAKAMNNNNRSNNKEEQTTTTSNANRGVSTALEVGRRGGGGVGKIQLRLEEEDETRGSFPAEPASNTTTTSTAGRARIFLQDDDPEFDDLDEDDPDDDLDI